MLVQNSVDLTCASSIRRATSCITSCIISRYLHDFSFTKRLRNKYSYSFPHLIYCHRKLHEYNKQTNNNENWIQIRSRNTQNSQNVYFTTSSAQFRNQPQQSSSLQPFGQDKMLKIFLYLIRKLDCTRKKPETIHQSEELLRALKEINCLSSISIFARKSSIIHRQHNCDRRSIEI